MPYARRDPHLVVPTWSANILGNSHTSQNHSNRLQMHLLPGRPLRKCKVDKGGQIRSFVSLLRARVFWRNQRARKTIF